MAEDKEIDASVIIAVGILLEQTCSLTKAWRRFEAVSCVGSRAQGCVENQSSLAPAR